VGFLLDKIVYASLMWFSEISVIVLAA